MPEPTTSLQSWLSFASTAVWQGLVVFAVVYFRAPLAALLSRVRRVRGGGVVVEIRENVSVTVPDSRTEQITAEHFALIHSCWRAAKHDERFPGHRVYRFDVILAAGPDVLDQVERVIYFLPPAWPTSPQTINDRKSSFGLKELAWADLLVRAQVFVRGQRDAVYLSCYVRLTEEGPKLIQVA